MKLKPILQNTVVHTPTEVEAKELLAILHEGGYEWYHKYAPIPNPNLSQVKYIHIYNSLNGCSKVITYCDKYTFVDSYITLAEFKERYCEEEKPQPKFKVGDKVRIIQDGTVNPDYVGIVDEIESIAQSIRLKNTDSNWFETCLEH